MKTISDVLEKANEDAKDISPRIDSDRCNGVGICLAWIVRGSDKPKL